MRNLQEYAQRCIREMHALGLKLGIITDITVNTRAHKRFGQCIRTDNWSSPDGYTYAININGALLNEEIPEHHLIETIHHELIHTLPGCYDHGKKFKEMCAKVNAAYGYNVTTRVSTDDSAVRKVACMGEFNPGKHLLICEKCGKVIRYQKRTKAWQHPDSYRHVGCGGHFRAEVDE